MAQFFKWGKSPLACATCAAYLFTNVVAVYAVEKNLWEERRSAALQLAQLPSVEPNALRRSVADTLPTLKPIAPSLPKELSQWLEAVPHQFGDLRDVRIPAGWTAQSGLVLILEDAHHNEEAQRNIAGIIEALNNKADAPLLVGIEGSHGPLHFAPYRAFPDKQATRDIAESFMKQGLMTGPEYVGMTSPKLPLFWGVEDPALYRRNVQAYRAAAAAQETVRRKLAALKTRQETLKNRYFNPLLKDLDARRIAHTAQRLNTTDYIASLARSSTATIGPSLQRFLQARQLEKTLDFARVEEERKGLTRALRKAIPAARLQELFRIGLACKDQQVGYRAFQEHLQNLCREYAVPLARWPAMNDYGRYVLLAESLDAHGLFQDIEELEKAQENELAKTPEEKNLLALSKDLELAEKLLDFALIPRERTQFNDRRRHVHRIPGRLAALEGQGTSSDAWEMDLAPFEQFDEWVAARDRPLAEKLRAQMRPQPGRKNVAVLVAGGFHSEGVARLLNDDNVACAVLSPRIGEAVETGVGYLDAFRRDKTPLEKLFTGERLSLAQVSIAQHQRDDAPPHVALAERQFTLLQAARWLRNRGYDRGERREILDQLGKTLSEIAAALSHDQRFNTVDLSTLWFGNIQELEGNEGQVTMDVEFGESKQTPKRIIVNMRLGPYDSQVDVNSLRAQGTFVVHLGTRDTVYIRQGRRVDFQATQESTKRILNRWRISEGSVRWRLGVLFLEDLGGKALFEQGLGNRLDAFLQGRVMTVLLPALFPVVQENPAALAAWTALMVAVVVFQVRFVQGHDNQAPDQIVYRSIATILFNAAALLPYVFPGLPPEAAVTLGLGFSSLTHAGWNLVAPKRYEMTGDSSPHTLAPSPTLRLFIAETRALLSLYPVDTDNVNDIVVRYLVKNHRFQEAVNLAQKMNDLNKKSRALSFIALRWTNPEYGEEGRIKARKYFDLALEMNPYDSTILMDMAMAGFGTQSFSQLVKKARALYWPPQLMYLLVALQNNPNLSYEESLERSLAVLEGLLREDKIPEKMDYDFIRVLISLIFLVKCQYTVHGENNLREKKDRLLRIDPLLYSFASASFAVQMSKAARGSIADAALNEAIYYIGTSSETPDAENVAAILQLLDMQFRADFSNRALVFAKKYRQFDYLARANVADGLYHPDAAGDLVLPLEARAAAAEIYAGNNITVEEKFVNLIKARILLYFIWKNPDSLAIWRPVLEDLCKRSALSKEQLDHSIKVANARAAGFQEMFSEQVPTMVLPAQSRPESFITPKADASGPTKYMELTPAGVSSDGNLVVFEQSPDKPGELPTLRAYPVKRPSLDMETAVIHAMEMRVHGDNGISHQVGPQSLSSDDFIEVLSKIGSEAGVQRVRAKIQQSDWYDGLPAAVKWALAYPINWEEANRKKSPWKIVNEEREKFDDSVGYFYPSGEPTPAGWEWIAKLFKRPRKGIEEWINLKHLAFIARLSFAGPIASRIEVLIDRCLERLEQSGYYDPESTPTIMVDQAVLDDPEMIGIPLSELAKVIDGGFSKDGVFINGYYFPPEVMKSIVGLPGDHLTEGYIAGKRADTQDVLFGKVAPPSDEAAPSGLGSIFNRQALRWGENSWKYRLYTALGASGWETGVFQFFGMAILPGLIAAGLTTLGIAPSLAAQLGWTGGVLWSTGFFTFAHVLMEWRARSREHGLRKSFQWALSVFILSVIFTLPYFISPDPLSATASAFLLHAGNNALVLWARSAQQRLVSNNKPVPALIRRLSGWSLGSVLQGAGHGGEAVLARVWARSEFEPFAEMPRVHEIVLDPSILRSEAAAAVALRGALEFRILCDGLGKEPADLSREEALMIHTLAGYTQWAYLMTMSAREREAYFEIVPPHREAYQWFIEKRTVEYQTADKPAKQLKVLRTRFSPEEIADYMNRSLSFMGNALEYSGVSLTPELLEKAYAALAWAAPLEVLLASGGDGRCIPDPENGGLTQYGSKPKPDRTRAGLGASTSNIVTPEAFAEAEAVRQSFLKQALTAPQDVSAMAAGIKQRNRNNFADFYGVREKAGMIVSTPSGSDIEFVWLLIAMYAARIEIGGCGLLTVFGVSHTGS
ncbi:MAG: hypothetical protein HY548_02555, partial [Elusimicrobia bacterium]|nr:hypothetical protein [Elusimicrobiota bacterium]